MRSFCCLSPSVRSILLWWPWQFNTLTCSSPRLLLPREHSTSIHGQLCPASFISIRRGCSRASPSQSSSGIRPTPRMGEKLSVLTMNEEHHSLLPHLAQWILLTLKALLHYIQEFIFHPLSIYLAIIRFQK